MEPPEMTYEEGCNWPCVLILLWIMILCGFGCYGIWQLENLIIH